MYCLVDHVNSTISVFVINNSCLNYVHFLVRCLSSWQESSWRDSNQSDSSRRDLELHAHILNLKVILALIIFKNAVISRVLNY